MKIMMLIFDYNVSTIMQSKGIMLLYIFTRIIYIKLQTQFDS